MSNTIARTLAVTVLAAGMAFSQGGPRARFGRPGAQALRQRVANQLNLTADQKAQAKAIAEQARRDAAPLRAELKQNRQAMRDAVSTGKGESEINQLAARQGAIQGQLAAVRAKARAQFNAQLTPEQKAKAVELRQQMRSRMQQRMNKRNAG